MWENSGALQSKKYQELGTQPSHRTGVNEQGSCSILIRIDLQFDSEEKLKMKIKMRCFVKHVTNMVTCLHIK